MNRSIIACVGIAIGMLSATAFAADPAGRTLSCGITSDKNAKHDEVTTHYVVGLEAGEVKVEAADYSFRAMLLGGELKMDLTEVSTNTKASYESYGGIPDGKMPKLFIYHNGAISSIGYCHWLSAAAH